MIQASTAFQNAVIQDGRTFRARILADGSVVDCEVMKATIRKGASDAEQFLVGSVYSSSCEVTVADLTETLVGRDISLQIGIVTNRNIDAVAYITVGVFTVTKIKKDNGVQIIDAQGAIGTKLSTALPTVASQTLANVAAAITSATGATITFDSGIDTSGIISAPLQNMSCRSALALLAFLVGGYATEDASGGIVIKKYASGIVRSDLITSDGADIITDSGAVLIVAEVEGAGGVEAVTVLAENCLQAPIVHEADFDMTGVKVIVKEEYETEDEDGESVVVPEVSYERGTIRQVYNCEYMTEALFAQFADNVVGYTFMPAEIDMSLGDPRIEPWDILRAHDVDGSVYNVPCNYIEASFDGGFSCKIIATGESEVEDVPEGTIMQTLNTLQTRLYSAQDTAESARTTARRAASDASGAVTTARGAVVSDTLHYLATSASSGVDRTTQGWTTTVQAIDSDKRYLWTYHTYTKANGTTADSDPVITGVFGQKGATVSNVTEFYCVTATNATPDWSAFSTNVVSPSADKPYLWNYELITFSDGTSSRMGRHILMTYNQGDEGRGIASITEYYALSTTTTAPADSAFSTNVPTMTSTQRYLWNYEYIEYTDSINPTITAKRIIGAYGDTGAQGETGARGEKGEQGVSITGVYPQYYLSTSATQLAGGSWLETLNYIDGRYIWTRERITLSNGSTTYSTAVYNSALTSAWINANSAKQIAEDTNQHFWTTETGTDTGAHITEKTQDDFLADPQNGGGNLLARSNGIAVRDGLQELATFGATGAQIGAPDNSRLTLSADGQTMTSEDNIVWYRVNKSGNPTPETVEKYIDCRPAATSVTIPDTPITGTTIGVDCYISRVDFVAGTTATKPLAVSGVTYANITYNATTQTITYSKVRSDAPKGIDHVWYRSQANAADFGVFQFGSRRDGTKGNGSATFGRGLLAAVPNEVVIGTYNEDHSNSGKQVFTIGDGASNAPHDLLDVRNDSTINMHGKAPSEVGFHAYQEGYDDVFLGWGSSGKSFGVYSRWYGTWLINGNYDTGRYYLGGVDTNRLTAVFAQSVSIGKIAANNVVSGEFEAADKSSLTPAGVVLKPVGIVGHTISGSGLSFCFPYSLYVDGDGFVQYGIRNMHSSASGSLTLTVRILYKAEWI